MIYFILFSCTVPTLVEDYSPLINPGEEEPLVFYNGPGILFDGDCTSSDLTLVINETNHFPYFILEDEEALIWVRAAPSAQDGVYLCSINAWNETYEQIVEVEEL